MSPLLLHEPQGATAEGRIVRRRWDAAGSLRLETAIKPTFDVDVVASQPWSGNVVVSQSWSGNDTSSDAEPMNTRNAELIQLLDRFTNEPDDLGAKWDDFDLFRRNNPVVFRRPDR
jgi:hypothetical protein